MEALIDALRSLQLKVAGEHVALGVPGAAEGGRQVRNDVYGPADPIQDGQL